MVQSDSLPQPWEGYIDTLLLLGERTRREFVVGKMTLWEQQLEERKDMSAPTKIMLRKEAIFHMESFMKLNDKLAERCKAWGIHNMKVAVICVDNHYKVSAVTPQGKVEFEEPVDGLFPRDELMTKLQLIYQ